VNDEAKLQSCQISYVNIQHEHFCVLLFVTDKILYFVSAGGPYSIKVSSEFSVTLPSGLTLQIYIK
jgi:hypothetical protein